MGEVLKKSLVRTRKTLQKTLEGLSPEHSQTVPEGFNNNILWQVGHIFVAGDLMYLNGQSNLEVEKAFFAPGTKPENWSGEVPS